MNFNTLEKSLENLLATFIADMEQSLKECFAGTDISVLNKSPTHSASKPAPSRGPGKTPQLTTTQNFRAKFWKSLHWLLYDELFETCTQIKLLKTALEQINQFGYTSETSDQCIPQRFWKQVQQLLRKSFDECSQHVTQTLVCVLGIRRLEIWGLYFSFKEGYSFCRDHSQTAAGKSRIVAN